MTSQTTAAPRHPIDVIDEVLRPLLGSLPATSAAVSVFYALRRANLLVGWEDEGTRYVRELKL